MIVTSLPEQLDFLLTFIVDIFKYAQEQEEECNRMPRNHYPLSTAIKILPIFMVVFYFILFF